MLIVTKPFRYGTRGLKVGDEFIAKTARDRRLMLAIGKVREEPDEPAPKATKAKAKAEDSDATVETEAVEESPKPEPEPEAVEEAPAPQPEPEAVEEAPAPEPEPEADESHAVKAMTSEDTARKKPGRPKKDS